MLVVRFSLPSSLCPLSVDRVSASIAPRISPIIFSAVDTTRFSRGTPRDKQGAHVSSTICSRSTITVVSIRFVVGRMMRRGAEGDKH